MWPRRHISENPLQHSNRTFAIGSDHNPWSQRGTNVIETRKRAVSIRMNAGDVRKVKQLAARLGVRDSDIIRFAIKGMLSRLGPLHDSEVNGCNLVPVFVESGVELLRFFHLDAAQLEAIINDGAEPARRVARDDVA